MSKQTGRPPAAGPWSRPCAAVDRISEVAREFRVSPGHRPSLGPPRARPAPRPRRLVRSLAGPAHHPADRGRHRGAGPGRAPRIAGTRVTWASTGPRRSSRPSRPAGSSRCPRCGPSTASSAAAVCWTASTGPTASPASGLVSARGGPPRPGTGQRRRRRGAGHQGRPPGRGPQRRLAAWRPGRLLAAGESVTAKFVVECLVEHWRQFGLPGYAQFDNDTIFQGPHAHPDVLGRVSRLCLSLGVVPVFVPPREPGFQAAIEGYNGSWQAKVWARFEHADLDGLTDRSRRHVAALRRHRADRIEAAPPRRAFPRGGV